MSLLHINSDSLKIAIVEDEHNSHQRLARLLTESEASISRIEIYETILAALKGIPKFNPDILYLDIELPDGNCFDLLKKIEYRKFITVITTAYEQHALKAMHYSAIAYLIKPIDPIELQESINKCHEQLDLRRAAELVRIFIKNAEIKNPADYSLTLKHGDGYIVRLFKEIKQFEGSGDYCTVHLVDEKPKLISQSLNELEEILDQRYFFMTHKSNLVNLAHVKHFSTKNMKATLRDDSEVPVSTRRKAEFIQRLKAHRELLDFNL